MILNILRILPVIHVGLNLRQWLLNGHTASFGGQGCTAGSFASTRTSAPGSSCHGETVPITRCASHCPLPCCTPGIGMLSLLIKHSMLSHCLSYCWNYLFRTILRWRPWVSTLHLSLLSCVTLTQSLTPDPRLRNITLDLCLTTFGLPWWHKGHFCKRGVTKSSFGRF